MYCTYCNFSHTSTTLMVTTLSLTNWKYSLKSLQIYEHTHYSCVNEIATDMLQKLQPYLEIITILHSYSLGF
jgi:NADPH-dependent 7-cyano-7-deazaguanine reductase QueF